MSIPHSPNKFNALQFHVHLFSEHQILGQGDDGYFPAELHVVHQEETEESYAVFGTMISVGAEDHPTFEYLLQGWESVAQQVQDECVAGTSMLDESISRVNSISCPPIGSTTIYNGTSPSFPSDSLNVYDLPTNQDFGVFTYKGGLTTPPCSEVVNWNLLDTPMEISESQLQRLRSLILCYVVQNKNEDESLESCGFGTVASTSGSTSRPPQPLLGREVLHRCPNGPDVVMDDIGVVVEEESDVSGGESVSDEPDVSEESSSEAATNDDSDCLSGGFIALYIIIGAVVAFAIFFVAHVHVVKKKSADYEKTISELKDKVAAKSVNGVTQNDNDEKVFHT
jgi:carbonic anhydrase